MATTWKELQENCLRKLFSLDGAALVRDSNTNAYLNSMPAAANEAMRILTTIGRYWRKCVTITQGGEEETPPTLRLGAYKGYDLPTLAGNFYCIREVRLAASESYAPYPAYQMEGDGLLLLPAGQEGEFRVWYDAYPPVLTLETPDDFVIDLPDEVAGLIPLYMAGQLYKDDDISIAQIYMNEFTAWLEELKQSAARASGRNTGSGWTSVKNWY